MFTARRIHVLFGIGAVICLLVLSAQAGAVLNTSGSVICAFMSGFDCSDVEGCQAATPESSGLPAFIKLDMANKKITAADAQWTGEKRETAIKNVHEADGKLFLQGVERRGWSAVINKETGQMAMAASSDNEAIVFFGRCTTP
ncbi:MAG: hypothetical protein A4E57_02818 [Syntrophorhabdaceae bacterium PtaU1.Bin034]|jgi:hypothetical protein|nr:MAG: hypothetical protein A4E57_02818 [Syntrophorhabdaceae bacterium PtaU1.Bin034]